MIMMPRVGIRISPDLKLPVLRLDIQSSLPQTNRVRWLPVLRSLALCRHRP
jgi:hypothetical protein